MYFIGVDGGGTKTNAILADSRGDTLRRIKEGSGNISLLDRGSIARLIRNLVEELLGDESIETISWATFAFAGIGRTEEKSIVTKIIEGTGIKKFALMTDAELLYHSIFSEKRGILISAGTGSICVIRNKDYQLQQIGGLGYILGDEGSGFDIGNKAIRAAVHHAESGKQPTPLTEEILSFYGLKNAKELITIIYSSKNPSRLTASCAKLVCETASKNEPNARHIVNDAAKALLNLAVQAKKYFKDKLFLEIALAGSILQEKSIVNHRFKELACEKGLEIKYKKQKLSAAAAAGLYSLKQENIVVPDSLIQKLRNVSF